MDGKMDQGRVRVLHVISGLGIGGAERLLQWTARYHDRDRYPVGVVSLLSGGELASEIRDAGVPLLELGQKRGALTPAGFQALRSAIASFSPEVVQGHMFHSNLLTRAMKLLAPGESRFINTIHTGWEPLKRKVLYGLTAPMVDGTITFSRDVKSVSSGAGSSGKPVRYIPYGIEVTPRPEMDEKTLSQKHVSQKHMSQKYIREKLGIDLPGPLWIAVGRLSREKGYADLIDAFARLQPLSGGPTLLIVGEGEDRARLEGLISGKGLNERVRLLGLRHDVSELLEACDAFVLSSHWEGGPLVLLEAMGAALPVVSTRVGTVQEMVVDGETALLVEPGRPDLLAAAMGKVMGLGSSARSLGEAGRKRLEQHFDFRRVQREMEQFYDELIHGQKSAASTVGEGGKEG
jgi:glycosyltransferase involved in cell wall biosynthesis